MTEFQTLIQEMRHLSTHRSRVIVASLFGGCFLLTIGFGARLTPMAVLPPLLLMSVATDLTWKFIPNWLTGLSALLAIGLASVDETPNAAIEAISGLSAAFAVAVVLYFGFGLGAGDVKLCACLGACLGPVPAMSMLLWSCSLSGILPLCRMALNVFRPVILYGCSLTGLESFGLRLNQLKTDEYLNRQLPLAGWFALGTLLTLVGGRLI